MATIANAAFGIDHPLIAVHDLPAVRDRLCALGFHMTPVGEHPWGTSTSLAVFDGCLLEIMGVQDAALLDEHATEDFAFGRHVHDHLLQREGIALTALHSQAASEDARRAQAAGLAVASIIEFGRDVVLPDGRADRTRTTLITLPNRQWPRLSFFLCQQHRPDLLYVKRWMRHDNSVFGIAGIAVLASERVQRPLTAHFERLYGSPRQQAGGFSLRTANGDITVLDEARMRERYPVLPDVYRDDDTPSIVAMDLRCRSLAALDRFCTSAELQLHHAGATAMLEQPCLFGNTVFRFIEEAAEPDLARR